MIPAALGKSKSRLMAALLQRDECRAALVRYLESEFNGEAVAFWEAVESFRRGDSGTAVESARRVAETFVTPGAPLEINIAASLRDSTLAAIDALPADDGSAATTGDDLAAGKAGRVLGIGTEDERESALRDCRAAARRASSWGGVFDAAQAEVERSLECDALDRFLDSAHGRFAAMALRSSDGVLVRGDVLEWRSRVGLWRPARATLDHEALVLRSPRRTRRRPLAALLAARPAGAVLHRHCVEYAYRADDGRAKVATLALPSETAREGWLDALATAVAARPDGRAASAARRRPTTADALEAAAWEAEMTAPRPEAPEPPPAAAPVAAPGDDDAFSNAGGSADGADGAVRARAAVAAECAGLLAALRREWHREIAAALEGPPPPRRASSLTAGPPPIRVDCGGGGAPCLARLLNAAKHEAAAAAARHALAARGAAPSQRAFHGVAAANGLDRVRATRRLAAAVDDVAVAGEAARARWRSVRRRLSDVRDDAPPAFAWPNVVCGLSPAGDAGAYFEFPDSPSLDGACAYIATIFSPPVSPERALPARPPDRSWRREAALRAGVLAAEAAEGAAADPSDDRGTVAKRLAAIFPGGCAVCGGAAARDCAAPPVLVRTPSWWAHERCSTCARCGARDLAFAAPPWARQAQSADAYATTDKRGKISCARCTRAAKRAASSGGDAAPLLERLTPLTSPTFFGGDSPLLRAFRAFPATNGDAPSDSGSSDTDDDS